MPRLEKRQAEKAVAPGALCAKFGLWLKKPNWQSMRQNNKCLLGSLGIAKLTP
jgi:hypothetical protein